MLKTSPQRRRVRRNEFASIIPELPMRIDKLVLAFFVLDNIRNFEPRSCDWASESFFFRDHSGPVLFRIPARALFYRPGRSRPAGKQLQGCNCCLPLKRDVTQVNIAVNSRRHLAQQMFTMETFNSRACKRCQHSNLQAVCRGERNIRDQSGNDVALSPWRVKGDLGARGY